MAFIVRCKSQIFVTMATRTSTGHISTTPLNCRLWEPTLWCKILDYTYIHSHFDHWNVYRRACYGLLRLTVTNECELRHMYVIKRNARCIL